MHIRVEYKNGKYDYMGQKTFELYLKQNIIRKFFRSIDKKWVTVGVDLIRGDGGDYNGAERRREKTIN